MKSKEFIDNDFERHLGALRKAYQRGQLSIFVGAGASASCGLPDWKTLSATVISDCYEKQGDGWDWFAHEIKRSTANEKGPLDAMRLARKRLAGNFRNIVRRHLYTKQTSLSETVHAVATMEKVKYTLTYNYDDLIEQAMTKTGRSCRVIYPGLPLQVSDDESAVIHAHGYLARDPSAHPIDSADIVLSEDDYHNLFSAPLAWPNVVQMHLLMSGPVLFVGCSLTDPNVRRLLDGCNQLGMDHKHYALLRDPTYREKRSGWDGIVDGPRLMVETEVLMDRGVVPLWYNLHSEVSLLIDIITSADGRMRFGTRHGEKRILGRILDLHREGKTTTEISQALRNEEIRPRLGWRPWWYGHDIAEILEDELGAQTNFSGQ